MCLQEQRARIASGKLRRRALQSHSTYSKASNHVCSLQYVAFFPHAIVLRHLRATTNRGNSSQDAAQVLERKLPSSALSVDQYVQICQWLAGKVKKKKKEKKPLLFFQFALSKDSGFVVTGQRVST